MKLKRLEVDGGFLRGLDLTFADGLNVLIGARGSGKTSVIEVLRYCLGIRAVTDEAQKRAREQALWVLGDGCATLTIELDGIERVIRRGINQEPDVAVPDRGILFASQKEVEEIALDSASRRRMLDAFADGLGGESSPAELEARVELVARQLFKQRSELDDVVEQLEKLSEVPEQLKLAEAQQNDTKTDSTELTRLQADASGLSDEIGQLGDLADSYRAAANQATVWASDVRDARDSEPDFRRMPVESAAELQPRVAAVLRSLDVAHHDLAAIVEFLSSKHQAAELRVNSKRRQLAALNARIEELEEGAGRISRAVSALREQEQRRRLLVKRRAELEARVVELVHVRSGALDDLAAIGDARHARREAAASMLNGMFGGEIRVEVVKAGVVSEYESALGRGLQGSNLQWRELSRQIADRMSPRELVAAVEALNADAIATAAGISENRARRVVSHLASADTTEIVLANVDEDVEFSLLDGQEWKETARLSLGQRCTVVLPLLLAQDPDLAVLDQPEDHLDNAFIVETVVDVLRSRREGAQRVIATHNANIPVLGEADRVVALTSTGREVFVRHEGPLEDTKIVSTITQLMEGGAAAFKRRAEFYGS